jgi:hypothetical protein
MASYRDYPVYPSPSTPFSGAGRNTPPDPLQRPSSALMEKMNAYPPDVYAGTPSTASPLQLYPVEPAKISGWPHFSPLDSPAHIGRSAPGRPFTQASEPAPVQKTYRTFLQWKAGAQATTADYQRNGFPSPLAWVVLSVSSLLCNLHIM